LSGFVYIWYDRKHKRFYVGSHWGTPDDNYICSSQWMLRARARRPQDFKRRILKSEIETKKLLLQEERRYLQMIKRHELKTRYYNLANDNRYHWLNDPLRTASVKEKISIAGKKRMQNPAERERIAAKLRGRKLSEEHKAAISANHNRDYSDPQWLEKITYAHRNRSPETRAKIAENSRRLVAEGKVGMLGRKHSEETLARMRAAQAKCPPPPAEELLETYRQLGKTRTARHYSVARSVVERWFRDYGMSMPINTL
jgi:hypothetical protein